MNGIGLFDKVTVLKKQSQQNEAMDLLKRMAHQVEPIMKKRGWKVKLLKEMYPKNPNLLVHGPHDNKFYGLLGLLTDECEQLIIDGIYASSFSGKGHRLGASPANSYGPPRPASAVNSSPFTGKGHKLGAAPAKLANKPPPTLLTYFTEQKKLAAGLPHPAWCASENSKPTEASSSQKRPAAEVVVISDDEDPPSSQNASASSWVCPACTCENPPLILQCMVCCSVCPPQAIASQPPEKIWTCSQCTLINQDSDPTCAACLGPRS